MSFDDTVIVAMNRNDCQNENFRSKRKKQRTVKIVMENDTSESVTDTDIMKETKKSA